MADSRTRKRFWRPPASSLVAEVIIAHSGVRRKAASALAKERGGVFSSRDWRCAGWALPDAAAVRVDRINPKTSIHLEGPDD